MADQNKKEKIYTDTQIHHIFLHSLHYNQYKSAHMSINNNQEGYNTLVSMWGHFWDFDREEFYSTIPCKGVRNGIFDCWSIGVVVHALGDCSKVKAYRDFTIPMVERAIKHTLRYRNPHVGGYSVYYHGDYNSGDEDICMDDCGHLTRGFVACYEGTGDEEYLTLAKQLMAFMMTGVVEHKIYGYKGLRWHNTKGYIASISNCVAATGALKLMDYSENFEKEQLLDFAKLCLSFLWDEMRDEEDNLIRDGIGMTSTIMDKHKYSYNTGNTLTALCLMYKQTGDETWAEKAKVLAEAATNRDKALYDQEYDDEERKFLKDSSFFNQLLIEGLADYYDAFEEVLSKEEKLVIEEEVRRHLDFFRRYCFDPKDGLYFMAFAINKLDKKRFKKYIQDFGNLKKYTPDGDDRVRDPTRPVSERIMCKSLIGAASAARIFFHGARVIKEIRDPDLDYVDSS